MGSLKPDNLFGWKSSHGQSAVAAVALIFTFCKFLVDSTGFNMLPTNIVGGYLENHHGGCGGNSLCNGIITHASGTDLFGCGMDLGHLRWRLGLFGTITAVDERSAFLRSGIVSGYR
ncbi:hypothetical protein [Sphingomonas sp. AX6]|uniref:hypothetical protein n=1 Tax=Sphingomonas sp. AX6 TaxID=2653171 RepID=UPI001F2A70CC|nr:hypothetical protein [Sphingomonas sp. AX6]